MEQIWSALVGAVVGGLIAFGAAEWSFRRARRIAADEANQEAIAILEGLITEIVVAIEIAARASTTPLPTAYLNDSMPLRTRMTQAQSSALQAYAYAALRYNGRVARIVAYGMGKRAAGKAPGSERPQEHGKEVARARHLAVDSLRQVLERRAGH